MEQHAVCNIAYLLGLPSDILEREYPDDFNLAEIEAIEHAEVIRGYSRFRQIIVLRNEPTNRTTPFTLRQFCREPIYNKIGELMYDCNHIYEAINKAGMYIDSTIVSVLSACKVKCPEVIAKLLFHWPTQDKKSLGLLSTQYKNKKYNYPYDMFIPKPAAFGSTLPYLLMNDTSLYQSPSIAFECAQQPSGLGLKLPAENGNTFPVVPVPESNWNGTGASYITTSFLPETILDAAGSVSYIDFDNLPTSLTAAVCNAASEKHIVKIFYDENSASNISHFENMPNVELIRTIRLCAAKSLVDNKITTTVMSDIFLKAVQHIFLYSGDSDFCILSEVAEQHNIPFTVIAIEEHIKANYVVQLYRQNSTAFILTSSAVIPTLSQAAVTKQLLTILNKSPLQNVTTDFLVNAILSAMGGEDYRAFLQKDITKIVSQAMSRITVKWDCGIASLVLSENI